ncbi:MAG: argininosuccinate lyase [Pseudonocardia sp.]|nr:argininosuccinate lyase [Pseudonocardia sp.]
MAAARKGPSPELIEAGFGIEIADAPLLHEGLNLADIAHVLALRERGLVADEPGRRLLAVLLDAHQTPAGKFGYDPAHGEVYNSRERRFVAEIGTDAGWLHAGRPRREAVRIAMRLRIRRDALDLIDAAADVARAASALAAEHAETFMADQTYLQHAQPSTFGHYLLSFVYPVQREIDRLFDDLAWVNRSPAGAGGVNGSRLGYDRSLVAERLGFDGVIEHTRDAMWQADGLIKIVSTATSLVTTLAKLAEDLEIWSSSEFDYVSLADGHTRSSVLMPQKRNPYALTMVRGEAGVLIGRLAGMFAISKTPSARSDNLIFAYGEVPRALELAGKATRLMAGVIAGLTVNAQRMYDALVGGFSQAADLADYVLAVRGVDYRTAYEIVGTCLRAAAAQGLRGVDITTAMLDEAARERTGEPLGLDEVELREVLDPRAIVSTRVVVGGAAPDVVRDMARRCLADAEASAARSRELRAAIDAAETALLQAAAEVTG